MNQKIIVRFFIAMVIFLVAIFVINTNKFQTLNKGTNANANINQQPEIKQPSGSQKPDYNSFLVRVNKNQCLPSDFVPEGLVNILDYNIPATQGLLLRKIAVSDLKEMIHAAKKEKGGNLKVISAYRSYFRQQEVYSGWVKKLGQQEALRQSARPGCSEHQLGTAVDFNSLDFSFAGTSEGMWLSKNAFKYGWVNSYPINSEQITGYVYEPWHYRYIGKDNALQVHKLGLILSKFLDGP